MPLIVPSSNRAHAWMLGLGVATFVAWLLAPHQGYKLLANLLTGLVVFIVCITCVTHLLGKKANRRLVILAAAASLGSCVGQSRLAGDDLEAIAADMRHFSCNEGRQIAKTGHGFGRDWQRTEPENHWQSTARFGRYADLLLEYRPESDEFLLGVPYPDMPRAWAYCKPDPATPASTLYEFGPA